MPTIPGFGYYLASDVKQGLAVGMALLTCCVRAYGLEMLARDDFDAPLNLVAFDQIPAAGSFSSSTDAFGVFQWEVSSSIPAVLLDTSGPDVNDPRGIVRVAEKSDAWFGISDTKNDDNPDGLFRARWTFQIDFATDLEFSVEMAAWGDFEVSDRFDWTYALDDSAAEPLFTSSIDTDRSHNYRQASGAVVTLDDPLLINETVVDNQWREFAAKLNGTGQLLTVLLEGAADGGDEAFVFDNLVVRGRRSNPGDFNQNGLLDADDLDLLTAAWREHDSPSQFDLDEDGLVSGADRRYWIEQLAHSYVGDANLDGEFTSGDLILVFQAGLYEDDIAGNATWASGDWNGDGDFDSADFVAAFQDGGFELGPRAVFASVPEPSSGFCLFAIWLITRRAKDAQRRRRSRPAQYASCLDKLSATTSRTGAASVNRIKMALGDVPAITAGNR